MALTFHNLNPGPADGTNILLAKILSRLGGLAQPGDHGNDLLARILAQLLAVGGGGGGDVSFNGNVDVTGDITVTGDIDASHVLATCSDPLSSNHAAIEGIGGANIGVFGSSTTGAGVRAQSAASYGVLALGATGVYGSSVGGTGIQAVSSTGTALKVQTSALGTLLVEMLQGITSVLTVSIGGLIKCIGIVPTPVALTIAGAATTPDLATGTHFRATLGDATTTINNPTNPTNGQRVVYELIQDGAGNRALALGAKFAFGTDITAAVLTTTASKRDFLTTIYNSTTDKHYVVAFVKGF